MRDHPPAHNRGIMSPELLNERVASAIASRRLIAAPMRRKRFLERDYVGIPSLSLAQGIVDLVWTLDLPDEEFIPLIMRLAREAHFDPIKSAAHFPKIPWPLNDKK